MPLANVTLGSTVASVTFSSISSAYRDLVVVINATSSSAYDIKCDVNGDTSSANYSTIRNAGTGSTSGSSLFHAQSWFAPSNISGNITTGQSSVIWHFMDYTATDKQKAVLMRIDNGAVGTVMAAGRWNNTSAISTIRFTLTGAPAGSFNNGSTFSLYGVTA